MKPTAAEVLSTIFEQVELDKINQEVDAMSDDEIAKDLEAAGYTQAKIDAAFAKQQKMLDEMLADEKHQRRQQAVVYIGGLATAAAVALVVKSSTPSTTTTTVPTVPTATTAAPPTSRAEDLRKEAFEACGRGHFAECEHELDEAKTLDARGDADPDVQRARRLIAEHH
jgi:hypothetical protein